MQVLQVEEEEEVWVLQVKEEVRVLQVEEVGMVQAEAGEEAETHGRWWVGGCKGQSPPRPGRRAEVWEMGTGRAGQAGALGRGMGGSASVVWGSRPVGTTPRAPQGELSPVHTRVQVSQSRYRRLPGRQGQARVSSETGLAPSRRLRQLARVPTWHPISQSN